jgi:hypothetical protein
VAWIFSILGFILDLFLVILLWWTIIGAIVPIIGIWVFFRVNSIKAAVDRGDAVTASRLNTTILGILALIFDGIIPGILLLVAKGNIDRAASYWAPPQPPPASPLQPEAVSPIPKAPAVSPTEIYCSYCGTKNRIESTFCSACGKELKK